MSNSNWYLQVSDILMLLICMVKSVIGIFRSVTCQLFYYEVHLK